MKSVVLVPDGVGIRNLVLGPFLRLATQRGNCHVLHAIPQAHVGRYADAEGSRDAGWHPLVADPESKARQLARSTLLYGQMRWADTTSMRLKLRQTPRGSWRHRLLERTARAASRAFSTPRRLQRLDRAHCRLVSRGSAVPHYVDLFTGWQPDVLLCSHHRPTNIIAPVLAARSLGIPTATLIFSWDNLTSKGRIVAPFDHYLVWSDLMREELLRFYPEIPGDRVHVVGTPQFDPYAQPERVLPREDFFASVGADPGRPLICYSGGDVLTCPEDPEHARIVLELAAGGELDTARGRPQVLVRPAPVDTSGRYDHLRGTFGDLLFRPPRWTDAGEDWSVKLPTDEDVDELTNLVRHADVGINLASTMTLDFALHDRPVVNVAFDVASPPPFGRPLWEHYYRYDHYRPVVELGAARFARSREELAGHLRAVLEEPTLDRDARRALVDLQVGVPPGASSPRILEALEHVA